jgi:hypothetical protein
MQFVQWSLKQNNGGCIIYIGASRYDLGQEYWFYDNFFGTARQQAGVAWRMAKYDQLIEWGPGFDDYWRFHYLEAIMFGDPELTIRTEPVGIKEASELNRQISHISVYPNPFKQIVTFKYQVLQSSHVNISIHDITGCLIRTIMNKSIVKGVYSISWDGKDLQGKSLPNGIYFFKYIVGDHKEIKKVILIR